ncbi:MAG: RidA family protein [Acidaminococcaceae bacterium]|nr:RidA family protein [Acidaminococcaceae bacterium]
MAKEVIATKNAPGAIGPYSQAIKANGFVFASGQLGLVPATGEFAEGGIEEQTRQSLTNVKSVLEAAGSGLEKVVKTTVFLKDIKDFAAMNKVYSEFFKTDCPARSAV